METAGTLIRTIALPGGERIPVLGIGTWNMGERRQTRADEIAALQLDQALVYQRLDEARAVLQGQAEPGVSRLEVAPGQGLGTGTVEGQCLRGQGGRTGASLYR